MRTIVDPDDVNQDRVVTMTDGALVELSATDPATLHRIARQLHVFRSAYAEAFVAPDDDIAADVAAGRVDLAAVAPLHRRVTELLERARTQGGRAATQLDLAGLLQDRTWTSSTGVTQRLEELTPTHRRNLAAWLERNSDELQTRFDSERLAAWQRALVVPAEPWVAGTPLYRRLGALIAAESGAEQAMDQARQVVRSVEFERRGRWPDR